MEALQLLHLKVYAILPRMNSLDSKVSIKTKICLKTVATPKSVNRDMQVKVIQLCDAAAALIQMHICTKYDDCSSYSL